jgi:hypothetical protein
MMRDVCVRRWGGIYGRRGKREDWREERGEEKDVKEKKVASGV